MKFTSHARQLFNNNGYYDKNTYRMSPAMMRARRPYAVKNMVGLVLLSSVPISIYLYTYTFLSQDDFDAIPIPPLDEETVKQLQKEYDDSKK